MRRCCAVAVDDRAQSVSQLRIDGGGGGDASCTGPVGVGRFWPDLI